MAAPRIFCTPHAHARCSVPCCTTVGLARCVAMCVAHGSPALMRQLTGAQSGWRLWWSQLPVVLYGAALTPVLLAENVLLCAVVGVYTLQFALESITGQHRFLSALQKGSVMSACYISPLGTPKVVLAATAWLCHTVVFARFHAARRALARPIRMWWEALPVLQTALSAASKADMAVLALCAALTLVTLALSEPDELCRWFGNLLLVMWGGAFGLRFAASSLLQVCAGCGQRCYVLLTRCGDAFRRSCRLTRVAKMCWRVCAAAACSAVPRFQRCCCCAGACSLHTRRVERACVYGAPRRSRACAHVVPCTGPCHGGQAVRPAPRWSRPSRALHAHNVGAVFAGQADSNRWVAKPRRI